MKFIKYLFFTILIFIILGTFIILNLGNFLDISEAPKKSDVIVSLGGGDLDRVKKSLELYKKDFSTKNILILTGSNENINDPRIKYIKSNDISEINIVETFDTKNTYEEMIFIKNFLIEKNYTSAIIVSDAPHSKRISYLLNTIKIENSSNLEFNIVSSSGQWWNKELYYKNIRARIFAILEGIKLLSSYLRYGFIEKIGMTDRVDGLVPPADQEFKKQTEKYLYKYLN
jgi:uncharacterized SAM-binding protein YcdF (DUF218 family)